MLPIAGTGFECTIEKSAFSTWALGQGRAHWDRSFKTALRCDGIADDAIRKQFCTHHWRTKKSWQYPRAIYKRCILGLLQPCPLPGGREGESPTGETHSVWAEFVLFERHAIRGVSCLPAVLYERRDNRSTRRQEHKRGKGNGRNGGLTNEICRLRRVGGERGGIMMRCVGYVPLN